MAGRTTFSQKIADAICERLADGESLRSICRDEEMPSTSTVFKWLTDNGAFSEQYAHAREAQADALFDDILEIADGKRALIEGSDPDVQRDRLAVDARKWMAGKLKGKYSDKLTIDSKAEVTHRHDLDNLADEELDALERIAAKLERDKGSEGEAKPSQLH